MKAFIADLFLSMAALMFMALVSVMAIDAWTYETYGDCEHCMVLGGYFEMRGE